MSPEAEENQSGAITYQHRPNRPKRLEPSPSIRSPRLQDVLCGRGGKSNKWPGNLVYREIVVRNRRQYQSAQEPQHKGFIVVSIIEAIHRQCPPGRFLRFHKASNTWQEISRKEAFSKTSQALRELQGPRPSQNKVSGPQVPAKAAPAAAAASLVQPEPVESRIDTFEVVDVDSDAPATISLSNPLVINSPAVDFGSLEPMRPVYGVPSRVPLEDDDDDLDDLDSVVYDLDKEFDYSRDSRFGKALAAGIRPLQIHIGIPFTPCRHHTFTDDDDQAAIISTSGHQSGSSGSEFDEESELGDDAFGIPYLPGCQMKAPSMTELLQREDSLAFVNAIFQV